MGPVRRAASMTSDLDRPPTCCVSRSSNNDGPRDRAHGATDCSAGALVCGIDGRVGRPHAPADEYAVHVQITIATNSWSKPKCNPEPEGAWVANPRFWLQRIWSCVEDETSSLAGRCKNITAEKSLRIQLSGRPPVKARFIPSSRIELTLSLMRMVSDGRGLFLLGDQRQPVMADPRLGGRHSVAGVADRGRYRDDLGLGR